MNKMMSNIYDEWNEFLIDFKHFSFEHNLPTDRPTNQLTDRTSFRGAMEHLKKNTDRVPVKEPKFAYMQKSAVLNFST